MAVRSARLAIGDSTAGAAIDIYTCPAGKTAIVKDVRVWAENGACPRVAVYVDSGADRAAFFDAAVGNLAVGVAQGFIVLEPGDQVGIFSQTVAVAYHVSGAELDGVAP